MVSSVSGGHARFPLAGVRDQLAGTRFGDVRAVAETGSTNDDLMALARAGAPEGVVLVADHQRAGRGRLGRTWTAPPGSSLLLSVLLRPPLALDSAHALTTALALAAVEACRDVAGVAVGLKWPNDLVVAVPGADGTGPVAERKLAGVLAESSLEGDRFAAVVVGLGLNVAWSGDPPDELADIAVTLGHLTGEAVDRGDLAVAVLRGLDRRYATLLEPGGRAALHREETSVSATVGRPVRVARSQDELEGTAVGIEPDGALRVEIDTDVVTIVAGDVVHLRALGPRSG